MLYAKQTAEGFHIAALNVFFPNTSFPIAGPDIQWLAELGVYPVEEFLYYDAKQTKRVPVDPVLRDGFVYVADLIPLTQEEQAELKQIELNQLAEAARQQRNRLLSESDWTQIADAPVDKQAWANYRQQLRDVSSQQGFPESVEWPVKPE